jgi:hypothetical protein
MSMGNGEAGASWGCAIEGQPTAMLQAALRAVARDGGGPQPLPDWNGEWGAWVRQVAERLKSGRCHSAVLFCTDAELACCLANKVPGIRAVVVGSVAQARKARTRLGANLLVVEMAGRTYFECRQILNLCQASCTCPPEIAGILKELDGHAHC